MNINKKSELHQSFCSVSSDIVFVALAQHEDFVSPVDLAINLEGASVAIVRQKLQELGDAVESDGSDRWRVARAEAKECLVHTSSFDKKRELLEIENKIFQITEAFFVELGGYLKQIRARGLYKTRGYKSFAKYCGDRFGYGRTQVHHIIAAAEVVNNLKKENVHHGEQFLLPTSERQVRHLAKLEPEEQVTVWVKALEDNNGKIPTGRRIQQIVRDLKESDMESSRTYKVEQQINTESIHPKLEIDSRYGKINRYLIPIKDEQLKQKIEQYAQTIGAATIEGAIARLLEQVKDE
ncbi:MAG: hypothetical protein AB4368_30210 [Xenococcaceae cyanobacterium]